MSDRRSSRSAASLWIIIVGSLGGLTFGYDTGTIGGVLLFLKRDLHLHARGKELVATALLVGALAGALIAKQLAERWGRRAPILLGSAIASTFGVMSAAVSTISLLIVARLFTGLGLGLLSTIAPMFIAESTYASIRGKAVGTFQLAFAIGLTTSFWIDYFLAPSGDWRAMFLCSAVPPALMFVGFVRLVDTPRWYLLANREGEARLALARLYDQPEVHEKVRAIRQELNSTRDLRHATLRDAMKPGIRWAFVFAVGFSLLEMLKGAAVFTFYAPVILRSGGFTKSTSLFFTGSIGLATVISTAVGLVLIDRWGRRPLMFTGMAGSVAATACIAVAFGIGSRWLLFGAALVFGFAMYHIFLALGVAMMDWVLLPEIFPNRLRSKGQTYGKGAHWMGQIVVSLSTLSLIKAVGGAWSFGLFAAIGAVQIVFVFLLAPETRGKSLELMEAYWTGGRRWPELESRSSTDETPVK